MKKSLLAFLIAVILMLGSVPAVTASPPLVEWSYDNSLAVTVSVPESRSFSPADFPDIDCQEVVVLEKETINNTIQYRLVLIVNAVNDTVIEKAGEYPFVTKVRRTGYGEYVQRPSVLTLDHERITLAVGEKADVGIDQIALYTTDHLVLTDKIVFLVNPDELDFEDERFSWMIEKNLQLDYVFSNETWYSINVGDESRIFEYVSQLAAYSELLCVRIVNDATMSGNQLYEYWTVTDPKTVSLTLSGGETDMMAQTLLDQTAQVRGMKAGTTTLVLERGGFGAFGKAVCEIVVTGDGEIGDVDASGAISADDALLALQQATRKITLKDGSQMFADYNGDNQITAADALLILQKATGKIDG